MKNFSINEAVMKYGRYGIVKEIGKGSMGIVYEAYDPNIERTVALKVLREDHVTSKEYVERFMKEAKAIGRLSHPGIVIVYDVGTDQNTIFIAMEFLTGRPLDKIIKERTLSLEEIVDLGIQAAEALNYAHEKGIVHRDVKPSNILVSENLKVKITDFGIAHIEDATASPLTQTGEILGTPVYMSPEQVTAMRLDGRSDLFSLGSILYELATGQRPFYRANLPAIINAVAKEHPQAPDMINSNVPKALSGIIMKCLEKDRENRYQTGNELAIALKGFLELRQGGLEIVTVEWGGKEKKGKEIEKKHKLKLYLIFMVLFFLLAGGSILFYILTGGGGKGSVLDLDNNRPEITKPLSGVVEVKSIPDGASVIVDEDPKGRTPVNFELSPGKHEIRISMSGYYDWEAQVTVKGGEQVPLFVELFPVE